MILGRPEHRPIFDEIDRAIATLLRAQRDPRVVCFNAHAEVNKIPPGAIVFNLENVGIQIQTDAFPGRTIWDFSARNVERWRASGRSAVHVPVGFHREFERFTSRPFAQRDIDVVFDGSMNPRRARVVDALRSRGLRVEHLLGVYGAAREAVFARARIALNMLYYDHGVYPILRYMHATAGRLAIISEAAPGASSWVFPQPAPYDTLVGHVVFHLAQGERALAALGARAHELLAAHPLTLPRS